MLPGPRAIWRMVGPNFGASYGAYIDRLLRENPVSSPGLAADWTAALDQDVAGVLTPGTAR